MILVLGRTRAGKTTNVVGDLANDPRKKIWVDPQDSLSRMAAKQDPSGLFDSIDNIRLAPQVIGLFESTGTVLTKLQGDQIRRDQFKEFVLGPRNLDDLSHPIINENLEFVTSLFQYQIEPVPIYWMEDLLNKKTLASLADGCHDHRTRERGRELLAMSPGRLRSELSPITRLVKPIMRDASVIARCGQTNPFEIIDAHQNVFIEGGRASRHAVFSVCLIWIYAAIHYSELYRRPLLTIVDEASNFGAPGRGFFTTHVLRAIATLEKYGAEFVFLMQTIHSLDRDIQAYLLDNARTIICYAIGSPRTAQIVADVMGASNLGFDSQIALKDRIRDLRVGERIVRNRDRVYLEQTPPPKDKLPWGLSDTYLQQFIEQQESSPWMSRTNYVRPEDSSPA